MTQLDERLLLPQRLIAQVFGVSSASVSAWAVEPRVTRGKTKLYWLPDVVSYRVGGGDEDLDLNRESARLKKAQADKTELEVEVLRKTLIPAEDVQAVWEQYIAHCRARLLSLPDTAGPRVAGETVPKATRIIRDLVYEALEELKGYDPDDYAGAFADGGSGDQARGAGRRASPQADGKPVGRRKPDAKQRGKRRARAVED